MNLRAFTQLTAVALLSCGLLLLSSATGRTAKIRWDHDADNITTRLIIDFTGEIEAGDFEKLKRIYALIERVEIGELEIIKKSEYEQWHKKWIEERQKKAAADLGDAQSQKPVEPKTPLRPLIRLNSRGGNMAEAMQIGRWVREKRSTVSVPLASQCASACVFILAGGIYKRVGGEVAIHRPYFRELPAGDVGKELRTILQESRNYFSEMNIPEALADEMFSIKPEDSVVLTSQALARYRLAGVDLGEEETGDLRQAELLGITRDELIRRRQTFNQAVELGACEEKLPADASLEQYVTDPGSMREYYHCITQLEVRHGLLPQ